MRVTTANLAIFARPLLVIRSNQSKLFFFFFFGNFVTYYFYFFFWSCVVPAKVANVRVVDVKLNEITLAWDPPPGPITFIEMYEVRFFARGLEKHAVSTLTKKQQAVFRELRPRTEYGFQVSPKFSKIKKKKEKIPKREDFWSGFDCQSLSHCLLGIGNRFAPRFRTVGESSACRCSGQLVKFWVSAVITFFFSFLLPTKYFCWRLFLDILRCFNWAAGFTGAKVMDEVYRFSIPPLLLLPHPFPPFGRIFFGQKSTPSLARVFPDASEIGLAC